MLEEGNTDPVSLPTTAQAVDDGSSFVRSCPRPQDQYKSQQGSTWKNDGVGPDRYYNHRTQRTWRCTLGTPENGLKETECTNMCAVQDQRCAEYGSSEGLGLKPPTCDSHIKVVHDPGTNHFSKLTHFTVHLQKQIGFTATS